MTQTLYVKGLMMAMAIPRIVTGVRVAFAVLNITAFLASEQYRFVLFNSGPVGAAEMLVSDAFAIASTGTKLMQFAEGYAASQEVLSEASGLISSTANSIQGKYPGALVGIRGSLARGMRFDKLTKGLEPFNESSWDVDAFVVSDQLAAESARRGAFRSNASLSGAEESIEATLSKLQGYRNDKPFTFRIFTTQEWVTNFSKQPFSTAENPPVH